MNQQIKINRGFLIHFLKFEEAPRRSASPVSSDSDGNGSLQNSGAHITLLGHILETADRKLEALIPLLKDLESSTIELTYGEIASFGANGQHKVLTLEDPSGALGKFHRKLEGLVLDAGFGLGQPQYSGLNYAPHVTLDRDQSPELIRETYGATLQLDSLSLVRSTFSTQMEFLEGATLLERNFSTGKHLLQAA